MNRMHVKRLERQTRSIMHEPWNTWMWLGWGGWDGGRMQTTDTKVKEQKVGREWWGLQLSDMGVEPWEAFWVVIRSGNKLKVVGSHESYTEHLAPTHTLRGTLSAEAGQLRIGFPRCPGRWGSGCIWNSGQYSHGVTRCFPSSNHEFRQWLWGAERLLGLQK